VLLVNVQTSEMPVVPPEHRTEVKIITTDLSRVLLHYGIPRSTSGTRPPRTVAGRQSSGDGVILGRLPMPRQ
jgi:K+ transporter